MITEKTGVIAPNVENIPLWLSARPQWIVWRVGARGDDLTKVPYAVETGTRVDATDLLGWSSFEDAVEAYSSSDGFYSGIGFCLASCDPFIGLDLDDCRDAESGRVEGWAQQIVDRAKHGYIELSPSGCGIHVIVEGKLRVGKTQKKIGARGKIEMYSQDRFLSVTGVLL